MCKGFEGGEMALEGLAKWLQVAVSKSVVSDELEGAVCSSIHPTPLNCSGLCFKSLNYLLPCLHPSAPYVVSWEADLYGPLSLCLLASRWVRQ